MSIGCSHSDIDKYMYGSNSKYLLIISILVVTRVLTSWISFKTVPSVFPDKIWSSFNLLLAGILLLIKVSIAFIFSMIEDNSGQFVSACGIRSDII